MRRASGLSFLVPSDSSFQDMNEEAIRQWLGSLSQEVIEALYSDSEEMFEVRQPKFPRNSHYSEESESSVVEPSSNGSIALSFSSGENSTGSECPNYEANPELSQTTRMESTTGGMRATAKKKKQKMRTTAKKKMQKMCSKYSFVDDEREWILEHVEIERKSLRDKGKKGTVEQIAPRIYNELYVYGGMGSDKRVKEILRCIHKATKRNPYRKKANVDVVMTVINNRTHRKERCCSTPRIYYV